MSSAESNDLAAVSFRWPALRQRFEVPHCLSIVGQLLAQFAACGGFAVKRLRDRGGAAHFAEKQHLYLKVASFIRYLQNITDSNVTGCFGRLPVGLNSAKFAGSFGQGAGFEKSSSPEPRIHAHAVHG